MVSGGQPDGRLSGCGLSDVYATRSGSSLVIARTRIARKDSLVLRHPHHAEEVRCLDTRTQNYIVPTAVPSIARAIQQVFHIEVCSRNQPHPEQVEIGPARLLIVRIEIDDHEDDVAEIWSRF